MVYYGLAPNLPNFLNPNHVMNTLISPSYWRGLAQDTPLDLILWYIAKTIPNFLE